MLLCMQVKFAYYILVKKYTYKWTDWLITNGMVTELDTWLCNTVHRNIVLVIKCEQNQCQVRELCLWLHSCLQCVLGPQPHHIVWCQDFSYISWCAHTAPEGRFRQQNVRYEALYLCVQTEHKRWLHIALCKCVLFGYTMLRWALAHFRHKRSTRQLRTSFTHTPAGSELDVTSGLDPAKGHKSKKSSGTLTPPAGWSRYCGEEREKATKPGGERMSF